MKCPKCGKKISDKEIAKHLASKGGSKSRRVLTPEQARGMVAAREAKRAAKGENK
jgi:predicted transcriptional regulator